MSTLMGSVYNHLPISAILRHHYIQSNPVNTATNGSYEFGRINGGGSNFMTGLFQVKS